MNQKGRVFDKRLLSLLPFINIAQQTMSDRPPLHGYSRYILSDHLRRYELVVAGVTRVGFDNLFHPFLPVKMAFRILGLGQPVRV